MESDPEKQNKKQYSWLKQYQFQKGQSGNPGGAKKGKRLKTIAAEILEAMDEEEKARFLETQDPEFVWRMAEGNPDTKQEIKQETKVTGEISLKGQEIAKEYEEKLKKEL